MLILTQQSRTTDDHSNSLRTLSATPAPPRVIAADLKKHHSHLNINNNNNNNNNNNKCCFNINHFQHNGSLKNVHIQGVTTTTNSSALDMIQPKISGELFIKYEDDETNRTIWLRSHVVIYNGILFITNFITNIQQRIPLRDFNLRSLNNKNNGTTAELQHSFIFALYDRQSDLQPIVTFKTHNEDEYNIWIKIISIELLKQTSLYNIKYLDIIGFTFDLSSNTNTNNTQSRRRSSSSDRCSSTSSTCSSNSSRCSSLSNYSYHSQSISELNLNIFKKATKDISHSNSSSSSTSISDEDDADGVDGHNNSTEAAVDSNKYLSYTEYKKRLAKERIQRVLKKQIDIESIPPVRTYTRVYNVREGIQLKSYNILNNAKPVQKNMDKTVVKESKKLNMLRKNTNQLIRGADEEMSVAELLKKCQNSDNYVPVKEKLQLFESLCKLGRKSLIVNNATIVSSNNRMNQCKTLDKRRTRSMYDLNNNHVGGVREICKYFETQNISNSTSKFNTIAKGYRKVTETNDFDQRRNYRSMLKSSLSYSSFYDDYDNNNSSTNAFCFKQFREGNKIISYV